MNASAKPLWCHAGPQNNQNSLLNIHIDSSPLRWLPAQQMGWWGIREVIHCFWTAAKPFLWAHVRSERLQGPQWVMIPCHNHQKRIKMLDFFSCTLSMRNDGIWYNESHPLLMKYFKTLLEYLYKNDDVYEGIYQSLWYHFGPWPSGFIAKNTKNDRSWCWLSAWQIGWWWLRTAIYCFRTARNPFSWA